MGVLGDGEGAAAAAVQCQRYAVRLHANAVQRAAHRRGHGESNRVAAVIAVRVQTADGAQTIILSRDGVFYLPPSSSQLVVCVALKFGIAVHRSFRTTVAVIPTIKDAMLLGGCRKIGIIAVRLTVQGVRNTGGQGSTVRIQCHGDGTLLPDRIQG